MKTMRMRSALLGTGAAVALLAAQVPASADEMEELRSQIQGLQDKMGKLEAAQRRKRRVAPAAAVEAGAKPRSWKLPGTNTSMQIGGYAKLDLIYDINAFKGDSLGLVFTTAPDGSPAARRQGNFRLHARQSRFWIRTWTPTDWGELETHIQGDFFGTGGNQLISNSNSFRLRHAYGRLGPVLAGQTWTNFMILEALPDVLDFAGPTGDIFVRQAQIRYTHSFGGGTVVSISIENPSFGAVEGGAGGFEIAGPIGVIGTGLVASGPDAMPDIVVGLTHTWGSGRASIKALFRQMQIDNGCAGGVCIQDKAFGWGIAAGFGWRFNNRRTAIGALFYYGRGIGRYTLGGPSVVLNFGAVPTPGGASLDTVETYGGLAWIQHRWTDTLRSTIAYGRNRVNFVNEIGAVTGLCGGGKACAAFGVGPAAQDMWTIHANLIWRPVPRVDIGVEYIYAFAGIINSPNGKVHRIMMSFKYNF
jgi:hypothetical protein